MLFLPDGLQFIHFTPSLKAKIFQTPVLPRLVLQPPDPTQKPYGPIHIFSVAEEDAFTLESFENLMLSYTAAKKDLILARVVTTSESVPPQQFSSVYTAHPLNRLLFRRWGGIVANQYDENCPLFESLDPGRNGILRVSKPLNVSFANC